MSQIFEQSFQELMLREGGYVLHEVPGDTGGLTYAGISKNNVPSWPGWDIIAKGGTPPTQLVRDFYWNAYWLPLCCEQLPPEIAYSIFSFAVNSSAPYTPKTAVRLVQLAVGVTPDGVMGPKTVAAITSLSPELFNLRFFLAKITRYAEIVNKNRTQGKFLLGWINRSLQDLK